MGFGVIVFGVLAFWLIGYNSAKEVKFTNFVCQSHNESWVVVNQCRIRAINRHKYTLNFNGTFLHPAYNISVEGQFLKKANGYKPWLYKFRIDACQFLRKPYHPLVILYYKMIRDFTNFNHTCPYVGPQIINGFHTDYGKLGTPTPTGEYLVTLEWFFDNKRQLSIKLYANVDEYEYVKPKR